MPRRSRRCETHGIACADGPDSRLALTLPDVGWVAIFVTGYHAANEELRIASAKAARIEAGENYVNETA